MVLSENAGSVSDYRPSKDSYRLPIAKSAASLMGNLTLALVLFSGNRSAENAGTPENCHERTIAAIEKLTRHNFSHSACPN